MATELSAAIISLLKEAFGYGFDSPATYNDTVQNSAEEAWAKHEAALTKAAAALAAQAGAAEPDMRAAQALIVDALENSTPTHAHYPEPRARHAAALAAARSLAAPTEPSQDARQNIKPPHWGAIHTEQSGKVELRPAEFRAYLDRAFLRGAAAACAGRGESKGADHGQ